MNRHSLIHTYPRLLIASVGLLLGGVATASPEPSSKAAIFMRRVFDWQVAHPVSTQYRPEHRLGQRGWVQGAFLTGVMEAYRATNDAAYLSYARAVAKGNGWQPGVRLDHADDHIVGQTYLELHALSPAPGQIDSIQTTFDRILAEPVSDRELWSWCDALYMSPPTFAKLAIATGNPRYLAAMDKWYWDAHDAFYDRKEHLFYRDKKT